MDERLQERLDAENDPVRSDALVDQRPQATHGFHRLLTKCESDASNIGWWQ